MKSIRLVSVAAAAICAAATTSYATTLDFDSGTAVISNNILTEYSQDGFVFTISQAGKGSIGANLFNTMYCVDGTGGAAKCRGNDDGDLVPRTQGENGVGGNVLIRQESHNRGNKRGQLDDDAASSGTITFTLKSGTAFSIDGFSAVDEQPIWLAIGKGEVCGPVDNKGNRDTGKVSCSNSLTSMIGVGDSFDVRYAGSGGVDSIQLSTVPLPAGLAMLLTALGSFAFWRRRSAA